ncbi:MAG TPA: hypothetical protein VFQ24_06730 [Terriglobia bacterium]|nr:hypothetical protein [Terriglobia bacterium]
MAIRAEKSGQQMVIYGKLDDEPDVQEEWNTKRRKLGALYTAVAIVAAAFILGPHMPGWAIVSGTFKSIVAAIW